MKISPDRIIFALSFVGMVIFLILEYGVFA